MRAASVAGKGGGVEDPSAALGIFAWRLRRRQCGFKLQAPSCKLQGKPRSFDSGFPRW